MITVGKKRQKRQRSWKRLVLRLELLPPFKKTMNGLIAGHRFLVNWMLLRLHMVSI
ncbi:hypothetical protein NC651_032547 [Populus alba x Populus x berolinensis]|nr:hypothetical protein NC651_032547 [Populus alba x Populus x berolinensis]